MHCALRQPRVAYVSLGCRTNRAETDAIAAELAASGCVLADERSADAIIVNTCAVTGEAEAKARKACRRALAVPGVSVVVATGCVASLAADSLTAACPGIVVVADKRRVAARVVELLGRAHRMGHVANRESRAHTGGTSALTPTGRTRPNVKIQDGCDHRCTYCIVWKARGPAWSVPSAHVVDAVAAEVASGAQEVVLTGINVGSYTDPVVGDLAGLLRTLLLRTTVGRVRIASIEPVDVTSNLLAVMAQSDGRIAPFLHVCLQSGSNAVLGRMGRPYDAASFLAVIDAARAAIPDIALGTDVIVGFPQESTDEFDESLAFCRRCGFSRMHVFRYSPRPGTPAAAMDGQVDARMSAKRAAAMRTLATQMHNDYVASRVGSDELVLVQSTGRGITGGLANARVDRSVPVGALVRCRATDAHEGELICC